MRQMASNDRSRYDFDKILVSYKVCSYLLVFTLLDSLCYTSGINLENIKEFQLPNYRMNFTAWLFVLAHVNVSPVKV